MMPNENELYRFIGVVAGVAEFEDMYPTSMYRSIPGGGWKTIEEKTVRFDRPALEERIRNLEANGYDASESRRALASMDGAKRGAK